MFRDSWHCTRAGFRHYRGCCSVEHSKVFHDGFVYLHLTVMRSEWVLQCLSYNPGRPLRREARIHQRRGDRGGARCAGQFGVIGGGSHGGHPGGGGVLEQAVDGRVVRTGGFLFSLCHSSWFPGHRFYLLCRVG